MNHIIIVKPDALGDFILATPALYQLRKENPDSIITLLASSRNINIARWCPDVDQVIQVPLFTMSAKDITAQQVNDFASAISRISHNQKISKSIGYLLRFDADFYGASPLLYSMNINKRIAYSEKVLPRKAILNNGYDNFMTECRLDLNIEHEVIKNIRLISNFDEEKKYSICLDRYETAVNFQTTRGIIEGHGIGRGNLLLIGIGASIEFKKLNSFFWISLLKIIGKMFNKICIIGSSEDKSMSSEIVRECPDCIDLCGQLTPLEVFSFAKHAKMAICTDSFVKHAAAAADVITIELSSHPQTGSTNSEYGGTRFGAWGNKNYIIKPVTHLPGCTPDQCLSDAAHCILTISIDDVVKCVIHGLNEIQDG